MKRGFIYIAKRLLVKELISQHTAPLFREPDK